MNLYSWRRLLVETLKKVEEEQHQEKSKDQQFSMAPMLNKENVKKLDWENKTAEQIKNLVRGLNL